mmetsp:Transcript_46693/g.150294  ORF Transcript_46693/g.150294 Transcript_46693/m.150294 type:complete len:208 (+) Transcript_46693:793-1416(+)
MRVDLRDDREAAAEGAEQLLERHVRLEGAVSQRDAVVAGVEVVEGAEGAVGAPLQQHDRLDQPRDARRGGDGGRDVDVGRVDVVEHQRRRAVPSRLERRASDVERAARVPVRLAEGEAASEPGEAAPELLGVVHPPVPQQPAQLPAHRVCPPLAVGEGAFRAHLSEEVALVLEHPLQLVVGAAARHRRHHRAGRRAADHGGEQSLAE